MGASLEGRVVVVTGATGELGGAVLRGLLRDGATCHAPVRSASKASGLLALDRDRVKIAEVDFSSESSVAGFYESLPSLWASVHCAGAFAAAPLTGTSLEDFQKMMSVNALTCFLCCREAVRRMKSGRGGADTGEGGRIVNVAAVTALEPKQGAGKAAYAASKAVVASLTLSIAEELRASRISINAVAPTIFDTPANRAALPDADHSSWPTADEIASTIAFLVSPANRTVNGAIVPVPGLA